MTENSRERMLADNGDEAPSNHSDNPSFQSILERRYSRRDMLRTTLAAAVAGVFAASPAAALARPGFLPPQAGARPPFGLDGAIGFAPVPVSSADRVLLPLGYVGKPFLPWGTPICGAYPEYLDGGLNSGADQECQIGMNHDGMHYFPLGHGDEANRHGLLCLNHEYIDEMKLHRDGPTLAGGVRPADEVRKEVAAHGVSVVEIRELAHGDWEVVRGAYNRRITAGTPMEISGPVRGSALVKTKYSPDGTRARGTLNNCAHGYTPWGTYLTCEENWAGYFTNRTGRPREHARYGVRTGATRYGWELADDGADEYVRFDASARGVDATDDYRNEPNTQGWIVEIDPFDPLGTPKKRTAMGRFAHEGVVFAPPQLGQPLACYSGDDAQNEYIYKFVTAERHRPGRDSRDMLDHGTLYVAVFHDDGSGEWRALDFADPDFRAAALAAGVEFKDQADVLVNTRLAADVVGATKMDRPEWGAVHPQSGEVYFTLTNNASRGGASNPVDAANPRANSEFGHIIRWREEGNRAWATRFEWDLFVLAGPSDDSQVLPAEGGAALDDTNRFASPDGLWFDPNGVLWIQTDMGGSQQRAERERFGNNMMLAANPHTGDIRRFCVGPRGQEVTGCIATPDSRTLFINFQHPGEDGERFPEVESHWPDGGLSRARSATLIITRKDGGVVGS
jgi:secreted PhoX family phosphatase